MANPRLLAGAAWLGFDLDHTLVRYEMGALLPLIYESLVAHICANPAAAALRLEAKSALRGAPFDAAFCQKGIVFDLQTGDMLKLDAAGRVARARHGYGNSTSSTPTAAEASSSSLSGWLDRDRIVTRYGGEKWRGFDALNASWKAPDALLFMTYFDIPAVQICAMLVDEIDRSARREGSGAAAMSCAEQAAPALRYVDIPPLLFAAFNDSFDAPQFAAGAGGYFPTVRRDAARFVRDRADVARWLASLRAASGTRTFIVTNSSYDYAQLLLTSAFGAEWRTLFDFCVYDAKKKKPRGFFACSLTPDLPAQPFLRFNRDGAQNVEEDTPADFATDVAAALATSDDSECVEFVGGSWIAAEAFMLSEIESRCGVVDEAAQHHPIVYCGDDYNGDIDLVTQCGARNVSDDVGGASRGWGTVAIVEELAEEEEEEEEDSLPVVASAMESWGAMHWCEQSVDAECGVYVRTPSWLGSKIAATADAAVADVADLAAGGAEPSRGMV